MRTRRARRCAALLALAALAGCSGPPPSAEQRNATNLNPSGRPYPGPPGIRSSFPPADINTNDPLVCHPEGPGTVCSRNRTD